MRTSSPRRLDHPGRLSARAFTLIEVLVSLVILLLVLSTLMQFMTDLDRAWKSAGADPFAEAENAFETISDRVAQATLEPYQDYADATGNFGTGHPDHPARRSDLAFVCGPSSNWLAGTGRTTTGDSLFFLAPQGFTQTEAHLGLGHLLNALGYFVEFGDETGTPAFILPVAHRWRWRLKEVIQPTESLGIYSQGNSLAWVQSLVPAQGTTPILAENVAALFVLPEAPAAGAGALAATFQYDSRDAGNALTRHQLPARINLILVALDEASAQALAAQNGSQPPALVPANLFVNAAQLSNDLASLDASLTAAKIHHRLFQRDIVLQAAAWTNTPSQ